MEAFCEKGLPEEKHQRRAAADEALQSEELRRLLLQKHQNQALCCT